MSQEETLLAQGVAHLEAGQVAEAIALFSQVIAQEPRHAAAYRRRAEAYEEISELEQAEADLDMAIAVQPEDADAYVQRAMFFKEWGGDLDQRIADLSRAIALNPALTIAYLQRGIAYYTNAELDAALWDLSQAIACDPTCHAAFFWRGEARLQQGLQRQTDAPPRPGYVRVQGGLYHDRQVVGEAIADMSRAIALHPDYQYLYHRALAWRTLGEWRQVIQDCDALLAFPLPQQIYRNVVLPMRARCAELLNQGA